LLAYPWSSFGYYLAAPEHRPHWIRVDRLLGEHGLAGDTGVARQEFERRMEARRLEPGDEAGLKALRRGWCLGSEDFKQHQLEALDGKVGDHHFGELRQETAQAKAERIIAEELGRLGWQPADLAARPKHDPDKVQLAQRLRRETTLSVRHIAERLHLGTPKSASFRLLSKQKQGSSSPSSQFDLHL
jgi:hypothetical protein